MKNLFLSTLAVAASMTLMTACSSEDAPQMTPEGDATVTLSVELPGELQSRTFGDGTTAKNLKIAVYVKDETTPLNVFKLGEGDAVDGNNVFTTTMGDDLKKSVQIQLASGKFYSIVCWADAPGSIYTFDAANQTVTADYSAVENNAEALDAFYYKTNIKVTKDGINQSMRLQRPFAQLNVGAEDYDAAEAAGITFDQSQVQVAVPNVLNLINGTVSGEANVTYKLAGIPEGETFPSSAAPNARYLSMSYLLAGTDKALVEVKFRATASASALNVDRTFSNIPVQRNYRTNIYGDLLTNLTNLNVEIEPEFNGENNALSQLAGTLSTGAATVSTNVTGANDVITVSNTATLTLSNNATITSNNKNSSLNYVMMAGKNSDLTITGEGSIVAPTYTGTKATQSSAIEVRNGGKITIDGNVTVDGNGGSNGNYAIRLIYGTVTINGGYFTSGDANNNCEVIYLESAYSASSKCYLYINGGVFESKGPGKPEFLINCYDSYRSKCTIEIKGGIFVGFNPKNNNAEGSGTNFLAAGYDVKEITYNGKQAWKVVPE